VSDHKVRGRTALIPPSLKLKSGIRPGEAFDVDGRCGRRSRVVLAPVAGVKSAEASRPDRALANLNLPATVTRGIRHREEREENR
jgi:hypothetical protein